MRTRLARWSTIVVALLCLPSLLFAQIQVTPVVSGLSSPLFVGHAGDGSNRLFIVERGGSIKVLQPGSTTPTLFLDIHTKIVAGGEQGLLGLAFHPQYISNGRFFVFYTRAGDGALVTAEYAVSANINVADPASEKVLLTILHPTNLNHNGGMLAFGPDTYLYIGVGDGGGAYDPPNNAQTLSTLLGKILRIDINTPSGYVSPPSNPFVGVDGRDEIFALGMRNPWRFSFDRLTGQQWVADVGQGAIEEVDTPIVNGGNYGWKLWEGSSCTNPDPSKCVTANYIFPRFEYSHDGARCSITGGYVYRGSQGTLPGGTYVYGDYCSGEIFSWNGTSQTVLLDTAMNISSFGEDEAGEIYVVNLGGTVGKLTGSGPPCTYGIAPSSQSFGSSGGTANVSVTAGAGCGWTAVSNASWIHVTSGSSGTGDGNVAYSVDVNTASSSRSGTITIAGNTFTVNQSGAATCTYSITPTRATFGAAAGTGSVAVTAGAGCTWTAVSNSSWITVTGGASGSGNGTVTYSVTAYTGKPRNRNGSITIAGQSFTVKQSR
jgi:glucose/arabinose dehydrogenase